MRDLKYKLKIVSTNDKDELEKLHKQKQASPYLNCVLLSSYSGLTNDPVGLNYFQGKYHFFLQNSPFTGWHANKSWGCFTSKDLLHYEYHGQAIVPSIQQDINGAFSGSAFVGDQEVDYYYTGNVKTPSGREAYTIKAHIDILEKTTTKEVLFKHPPQSNGEYRDPYLFKFNNEQYLICGSQDQEKNGTIYVHKQDSLTGVWNYFSELKVNLPKELQGYMIECPNLIKLEDNKWLLIFSNEQDKDVVPFFHHKTIAVIGYINNDITNFEPITNFNLLNYGPDFYAPQVFTGPQGLQMIGWLGTSQNEQFVTEHENWAYDLSLVRDLKIKDNTLIQTPVIEQLLNKEIKFMNGQASNLKQAIYIQAKVKGDFELVIKNKNCDFIKIDYKDKNLFIDRGSMTFVDQVNFSSFSSNNLMINSFDLIVDKSVLEMFINDGEKVLSVKFFVEKWDQVETNVKITRAMTLKKLLINWNNDIFKQISK